ncbi:MAG: hypothetical protein BWK79_18500 [Beggiatoa sp. IS2]|nr:MAG: hypothetical protein BWK79_18500 [Beggiatoa sp. IS2]
MNINALFMKILFSLIVASLVLSGCAQPLVYGVPEAHWRSLTDEQKKTAIEGYYKQESNHSYIYVPSAPNPYPYYYPHGSYYQSGSYPHDSLELQRERDRADYYEQKSRELEQTQQYTPPPVQTQPADNTAPTLRCGDGGASCRQFKRRL